MENIEFYNDETILKNKNKLKKYLTLFICILVVFIVLTILVFVLVNRKNVLAVEISFSIVLSILFVVDTYIYFNFLKYSYLLHKHFSLIKKETAIKLNNVQIIEIKDKLITLSSRIKCYQVQIKNNEEEIKTYYLVSDFDIDKLIVGESCSLSITSSYIKEVIYEK